MIVSELAPWLFVIRALVAWGLIALGALELGVGQAGLALFVFSQAGLLPLIARSLKSSRDAGASVGVLDLFKAWTKLPDSVTRTTEVRYWDDLTLDMYRRADASKAPTLIYVHGGSWMRGRPGRQALPLIYGLAEAGWVILDIRYPLSPVATFPDHLVGVKRAIAWAKTEGRRLGVDPDRVSIAGGSSGAHLASLAALTWDDDDLQPGFESVDTSVVACVPHYGIYDLLVRNSTRFDWPFVSQHVLKASSQDAPELYRSGSPIDLVRADAPPFLVVHGELDSVVLAQESHHFVNALRSAGAGVEYHEVRGAQHGFDAISSIRTRAVGRLVAAFLIDTTRP
jgi:acetyl esterase/lipase